MIERAGSRHGEGEPDVKILRWNLAENATRNQLLGDTLLQLPPDTRQRLEAAADAAGVPDRHHHDIGEVLATIDGLVVSPAVRDHMRAIYTILAEAEAAAHGCAVEQTHFHEVGDGSRIRNTLLVCLAVEATGVKRIVATVAQTGQGEVECAHGTLSIPAPATSAIIARGIPVSERTLPGERMTPTSAAMILHFVDEFE
ncbi:nickel insertion protein [Senegalimassilia anaerobia]|uniref:nickel insertion protein n=1 Tax=Senegalimassilia anaerobia TaxID=1473216 RepID=UPI0039E5F7D2